MSPNPWIVVKVGGSLFDLPDLRSRLRLWLTTLGDAYVLIVPGGGATADAIRVFDRTHHLGEEAAHWLAIEAMSINARILQALIPDSAMLYDAPDTVNRKRGGKIPILPNSNPARSESCRHAVSASCEARETRKFLLDASPFFQADEARPDHLPHDWQVTSDSLAVRAALRVNARELVLLKSVDWHGDDWSAATMAGVVDEYFAEALKQAPGLRVRIVNLRAAPAPVAAP